MVTAFGPEDSLYGVVFFAYLGRQCEIPKEDRIWVKIGQNREQNQTSDCYG